MCDSVTHNGCHSPGGHSTLYLLATSTVLPFFLIIHQPLSYSKTYKAISLFKNRNLSILSHHEFWVLSRLALLASSYPSYLHPHSTSQRYQEIPTQLSRYYKHIYVSARGRCRRHKSFGKDFSVLQLRLR